MNRLIVANKIIRVIFINCGWLGAVKSKKSFIGKFYRTIPEGVVACKWLECVGFDWAISPFWAKAQRQGVAMLNPNAA